MTSQRQALRRIRNASLALLALAALVPLAAPARGGEPGSAGTDTALPLTASAMTVEGRGPFGGLSVTVNQTDDLVNQAVSVTWTGGEPTVAGRSSFDAHYLQIMQCWGDPDGSVPENPGPPPEQCVQGAADSVYGGRYSTNLFPSGGFALERIISRVGWPGFDASNGVLDERTGFLWKPFRSVTGETVDVHYDPTFSPAVQGGSYWLNPFFNSITTNELISGRTRSNGTGAELFEVTTGLESSGLGCGQRVQAVPGGAPKVPQCWLVVVPRGSAEVENRQTAFDGSFGIATSPLAPEIWANRIAIPLDFNSLDSSCQLSAEQRRISGSEPAAAAVSSWQPALCATPGQQPFAYASVGDVVARQQLLSDMPGGPGMAVISRPIDVSLVDRADPVVYAPMAASGLAIAFNVERIPEPGGSAEASALAGVRVADINLTPRLVAKLLTQSYRSQTAIMGSSPHDWAQQNPAHLGLDPDFLQFNPEFKMLLVASGKNFGGLVLPSGVTDAPRQVWEWVLADPEAKAWLDGEPDEHGMVVNPVYATSPTANPSGSPFASAPPMSFPKDDPHCFAGSPQGSGGDVVPPLLCGTEWLPYAPSMLDAARLTRAADDGARTTIDPFALASDQVYRRNGPQGLGRRSILAVTTVHAARQYGLQTARLSRAGDGGDDRTFVAADEVAMAQGLTTFRSGAESTVLEPDPTVHAPGAYPLTSLSYAAVAPLSLDADAREDFAAFLDHAAGPGQVPGRAIGQLPPGYVPLTQELAAQAAAAAQSVRDLQPIEPLPDASGGDSAPIAGPDLTSHGPRELQPQSAGLEAPPVAVPAEEGSDPRQRVAGALTPILALARSRFVLPVLVVIALASALGTLEITKRPRRSAPPTTSTGSVP